MAQLVKGKVYEHPDQGPIYVTSGSYYGAHGRISNHFYWKKVLPCGSLDDHEDSGYGADWPELEAEITIMVDLC